jgi:CubicO group peptidase (beta-lactamase class C family)
VFELASITKVFTTTSLAMELEAGKMQLDDPAPAGGPTNRPNRSAGVLPAGIARACNAC